MGRKPKDTKHLFLRGGRWWIKFNRGDTHIIKTTGCVEADLKGAQDKRDVELRPHLLEDEVEKKAEAVKNLTIARDEGSEWTERRFSEEARRALLEIENGAVARPRDKAAPKK